MQIEYSPSDNWAKKIIEKIISCIMQGAGIPHGDKQFLLKFSHNRSMSKYNHSASLIVAFHRIQYIINNHCFSYVSIIILSKNI